MRRFLLLLGVGLLAVAGAIGFQAATLPWGARAPFDVLGILWLLYNLPKILAWGVAGVLVLLSILSLRTALRLPAPRSHDLAAEEKRLREHLVREPSATERWASPPGGDSSPR